MCSSVDKITQEKLHHGFANSPASKMCHTHPGTTKLRQKRRAAKKKKKREEALLHTTQAKQADDVIGTDGKDPNNEEFNTVSIVKLTIPIEELVKVAVFHNEAECGGKANEVEVLSSDEATPVDKDLGEANRPIEVSNELKVATDENVLEGNEISLLEVISDDVDITSKDEPVLSEKEVSLSKNASNEEIVVSKDEPLVSEYSKYPDVVFVGTPEEIKDTTPLVSGVSNVPPEEVKGTTTLVSMAVNDSKGTKQDSKFHDLLSFGVPEEIDSALLVSGLFNDRNAAENTSMFHDQLSVLTPDEKDTIQLASEGVKVFSYPVSELPVVVALPSSNEAVKDSTPSARSCGSSSAEMALDKLAESSTKVSPATVNQVYLACPVHCNPECCFHQSLRGLPDIVITAREENIEFMSRVKELECALQSLKAVLQIALDKLNAVSSLTGIL